MGEMGSSVAQPDFIFRLEISVHVGGSVEKDGSKNFPSLGDPSVRTLLQKL